MGNEKCDVKKQERLADANFHQINHVLSLSDYY